MGKYDDCLTIILKHEGGYVNHPSDPGGATNLGVTQHVYESWVGKSVTVDDMKALVFEDVAPIYRKNYWDKVHGDNLPRGLDLCVFDFAVNAGPRRAAKYLQRLVNSAQDGKIGPNTLARVNEYVADRSIAIGVNTYQQMRQAYYESLHHFDTFGKGWTRRVNETTNYALKMI